MAQNFCSARHIQRVHATTPTESELPNQTQVWKYGNLQLVQVLERTGFNHLHVLTNRRKHIILTEKHIRAYFCDVWRANQVVVDYKPRDILLSYFGCCKALRRKL